MKTQLLKAALCGSVLVAVGMSATAAQAATANADARARVVAPVSVAKVNGQDLEFGAIVPAASASTVQVSSAGARTCGGVLTCTGTTTAAGFTITGATGETVLISSAANVSLTGPGTPMVATLTPSITSLVLDGTDGFTVGGSLAVGANQTAGNYSGTFAVTVNYQ